MQTIIKFGKSFISAVASFVASAIGYGYSANIFWLVYAVLSEKPKEGWEGMAVIFNAVGIFLISALVGGILGLSISLGAFHSRNWKIDRHWISIILPLALLGIAFVIFNFLP